MWTMSVPRRQYMTVWLTTSGIHWVTRHNIRVHDIKWEIVLCWLCAIVSVLCVTLMIFV